MAAYGLGEEGIHRRRVRDVGDRGADIRPRGREFREGSLRDIADLHGRARIRQGLGDLAPEARSSGCDDGLCVFAADLHGWLTDDLNLLPYCDHSML